MSIYHTLNIGAESLYANRQGVDTAGHNIANAQTEGFSRQRVNLRQRNPLEKGGIVIGDGVYVGNIDRAHDKFIEKQLNLAKQDLGKSTAKHDALVALESIFSPEMSASVSDQLTNFFNQLHELSASPQEAPVRANLRESAKDLATAFRRVDESLGRQQTDLNSKIEFEVKEANSIVSRIARLNVAIATVEVGGESEANDLRDQRDLLVRQLSEKMDISYYTNEHNMLTVRGPSQSLLVDGKLAGTVTTSMNALTGLSDIVVLDSEGAHPQVITPYAQNGKLAALIEVRDSTIGELKYHNNLLAATLVESFNAIHRDGYGLADFKESKGRDFFETSSDFRNAAKDIKISDIVASSIDAISAAATPHAPGDNIVVNQMLDLRKQTLINGNETMQEHYANYVGKLGIDIQRASNKLEADDIIYGDVSSRREAVSGVSLDEEATNLMRWQTAFAASSKVITTADEMLETILSLKR